MSDALTDLARDERRGQYFDILVEAVLRCLREPSVESEEQVMKAARDVDSVPRGYWSGQTKLADQTRKLLIGLREGDRQIWAFWLDQIGDTPYHKDTKAMSPFAGKTLVYRKWRRDLHSRDIFDIRGLSNYEVFVFEGEPEPLNLMKEKPQNQGG